MASLYSTNPGRWTIQFVAPDGRRPIIRLGKIAKKVADGVRMHVENLVNAKLHAQAMPRDTAAWLGEIGDAIHEKLAKAHLVTARPVKVSATLKTFLDTFITDRTASLKTTTVNNLKQARKCLCEHFGDKRDLTTINRGQMGDWHRWMKGKYAKATVAMHVKKVRQFFKDAVDRKLISDNPAAELKAGAMTNADRFFYVTVENTLKIISACPDSEWKLIFALARFGGLRTPSEARAMLWTDINWETGRILIRSSKTDHHAGRETREIPIFPELTPYLRDAMETAETGATMVIVKHRGENLRTQAERIINKSGVPIWPKLFQNMRSSCETDLTAHHPLHVCAAWLGHTEAVAKKHYLQVTADHFDKANGKSAAKSDAEAGGNDRKELALNAKNGVLNANSRFPNALCGGRTNRLKARVLFKSYKRVMRKALHRLTVAAPHIQHDEINRLRRLLQNQGGGR